MPSEKDDLSKRVIKKIEANQESYDKFGKQMSFFDPQGKILSSKPTIELSDLNKIDVDLIITTIPKITEASNRQVSFERMVERLNPTIQDTVDFI